MTIIPAADPLPLAAPPSLLRALLMLTFFVHLVAMNFVLGGSVITALARLRRLSQAGGLLSFIGRAMPIVIAAAVTFGVAPLLFVQTLYGRLFFASSVLMAWSWLAVVPMLVLAYYGAYLIAFKPHWAGALAPPVALLFAGIAFLYSNNMSLMLRPERFLPMYQAGAGGLHLNLADPTLVPRYLHMLLGAVAVAGMIIAIYGQVRREEWVRRHGTLWFVTATSLNILTGLWWMGTLPPAVLRAVMFSPWLIAGIMASLVSLMAVSRRPRIAGTALGAGLAAMILARDEVRREMLDLAGFRIAARVEPQWTAVVLFALLLVAALATTAWMVTRLTGAAAGASGPSPAPCAGSSPPSRTAAGP